MSAESEPVEAYFRLLVESLSDHCVFGMDLEGRTTSWNSGCERLTGWSAKEMIGQHAARLWVAEDQLAGADRAERETALRDGRAVDERWHYRSDGSRFWGSGLLMPLRDASGDVRGFVKVMRDKTTERMAADELALQAKERETLIEELKHANELKDEVLSLVSHELRTPLTVIISAADVLQAHIDALSPETRRLTIADVQREARRLQVIIEDMLVLARLGPGRPLATEPVLLNRAVQQVATRHQITFPNRKLIVELPGEIPPVLASPTYLDQIVTNVLVNSERYADADEPIEISVIVRADAVELIINDHGRQLDPGEADRFFEPFYRAPIDAGNARGLGLGLPVCRRLAEAQGGSIEGEARVGGGLTVRLRLRIASDD